MSVGTYALTKLQKTKAFMGKESPVDDSRVESLIDGVSDAVESYIGFNILSREYTEYYSMVGGDRLFTKQGPITSVSGIWVDTTHVWSDSYLVESTNYRVIDNSNQVFFKTASYMEYPDSVKIIYTAGVATVPPEIQLVVETEVARMFNRQEDLHLTAKSAAGTYVMISMDKFLPESRDILNRYRRKGAV